MNMKPRTFQSAFIYRYVICCLLLLLCKNKASALTCDSQDGSIVYDMSNVYFRKTHLRAAVAQAVTLQPLEQEVWGSIPASVPMEIF